MSQKRNFSIGITVNLDNYENLRLDVGGEIEDQKDAEALIGLLDQILAQLGRGSKETANRVDSYRSRVFALQSEEKIPEAEPVSQEKPVVLEKEPLEEKVQAKVPASQATVKTSEPAPATPAPTPPPVPAGQPAVQTVKTTAPSLPQKEPVATPASAGAAEFTCEECQAPVSKGQNQMSQLFTGRTLCKKCMKSP